MYFPQLVIASHNIGKAEELAAYAKEYARKLHLAYEIGLADVPETGDSFAANALLKAQAAVEQSGLPAIADDCGLEVESLGGQPGIFSKRYAMKQGSWSAAIKKLNQAVTGLDPTSYMCCALALALPNGVSFSVLAKIEGILVPYRGDQGFGFDPCFLPKDHQLTFGEMNPRMRAQNNHATHLHSREEIGTREQGLRHAPEQLVR
mgnify:CR=1 FL=1